MPALVLIGALFKLIPCFDPKARREARQEHTHS
jgi:hypothetical protein